MTAIMCVFLVGFGVLEFALLFPHTSFSLLTVRDMLLLSFWQMFMELYQEKVIQVRRRIIEQYTFIAPAFILYGYIRVL